MELSADDLARLQAIAQLFNCNEPSLPICLYRAGMIAGIRRAADACHQSWQDGYRGEVNTGFEKVVRMLESEGTP